MTTTEQRAAFIRAICEQPFDDAPRLQYADWLLEQKSGIHRDLGRLIAECLRRGERGGFLDVYAATSAGWLAEGPGLVSRYPIVKVRIVDKEPWFRPDEQAMWFASGPNGLPIAWFNLLSGGNLWRGDWHTRFYPTAAEAHAALSCAVIDWARAKAGLPALKWSRAARLMARSAGGASG